MKDVLFINSNEALPTCSEKNIGWYVLKDSLLYIGTTDGWKELTDSKIGDLSMLNTINKQTIVDSINELKKNIEELPFARYYTGDLTPDDYFGEDGSIYLQTND